MAELAGGDSTTIYDTAFAPASDEEEKVDDAGDGDGDGDANDEEEVASPQLTTMTFRSFRIFMTFGLLRAPLNVH